MIRMQSPSALPTSSYTRSALTHHLHEEVRRLRRQLWGVAVALDEGQVGGKGLCGSAGDKKEGEKWVKAGGKGRRSAEGAISTGSRKGRSDLHGATA